jgi:hypothetical protein
MRSAMTIWSCPNPTSCARYLRLVLDALVNQNLHAASVHDNLAEDSMIDLLFPGRLSLGKLPLSARLHKEIVLAVVEIAAVSCVIY